MNQPRISHLQEMLRDEPEDAFLNYALAMEYVAAGDNLKAIGIIEALLKKQPEYLGAYYQLGKLLEASGETSRALAVFEAGKTLAMKQGNRKTLNELNEAIQQLDE